MIGKINYLLISHRLSPCSCWLSVGPKSVLLGILSYSQKQIAPFRSQNQFAAVTNGENREREQKERKELHLFISYLREAIFLNITGRRICFCIAPLVKSNLHTRIKSVSFFLHFNIGF